MICFARINVWKSAFVSNDGVLNSEILERSKAIFAITDGQKQGAV